MKYDLTAAVIGTGFMGKQHIAALSSLVGRIIICTADEKTGNELKERYNCPLYTDYAEMLEQEKPDLVSVCLPTPLHRDVTVAALERGIGVICEKPFAPSPEDAEAMLDASKRSGAPLMIAHCLRFEKIYAYLKQCVEDGRFGKLLSFSSYRETPKPNWSVGNWLANTRLSGGVVRDLHIHDTDFIVGLLGVPESVYTVGGDTYCRTLYKYGNLSVSSSASWRDIKNVPFDTGIDAAFERAVFISRDGAVKLYTDEGCTDPICDGRDFEYITSDDSVAAELDYFCRHLIGAENIVCPPEDSLKTITVSFAESESLALGKEVRISNI